MPNLASSKRVAMYLDALCISDYVAMNQGMFEATGAVHSVFRASLNVVLDGFLLHIGSTEAALSCLGIAVSVQGVSTLVDLVEPGDRAAVRSGRLRLYGRSDIVEIDLVSAPIRGLSVPVATVPLEEEVDIPLCRELSELGLSARIGLPWDENAARSLAGLARLSAVCRAARDAERLGEPAPRVRIDAALRGTASSIAYLLGRGLGLTPSGDDVLCGFGCGLCYLWRRGALGCDGWGAYTSMLLDMLPGKTTAVSEAYLRAMCAGLANEDYIEMLASIDARGTFEIQDHFEKILAIGHTSGADSLLGFGAAFGCVNI